MIWLLLCFWLWFVLSFASAARENGHPSRDWETGANLVLGIFVTVLLIDAVLYYATR